MGSDAGRNRPSVKLLSASSPEDPLVLGALTGFGVMLLGIYWTPKGAGRKCGEVLAGRRDPYQASLLCGDRVWMMQW
jgi:hypothetical protein